MQQCLFILLFFTGFAPLVLSVPHKYCLINPGKTWSEAQAYCRATHIDLAVIESHEDMVQLQIEAQFQKFNSDAWIGLYNDLNSWRWSMGDEPLGSVTHWSAVEPNNYGGSEACGVTSTSSWNDSPCTSQFPFVCFDDTKSGNERYIYISTTMAWLDAQSYCRQHHTDLASARDTTEFSIIQGIIPTSSWIGLFRHTWKWINQTSFSTISWMAGQPDYALGNEICGYLNNGQAGDARCSTIMPFFCYSEITTKQQTVKVKVQSDQDVNDPAVKAAILEQITQKLKDHEMAENITVKWKEQPDGMVFHKQKENTTEKVGLC